MLFQQYIQMNKNKKFSSCKTKNQIDQLLNPILITVRKNKINSFIQLKNVQKPFQQRSYIFQPFQNNQSKTLQLASKTHNERFSSPRLKQSEQKYPKTAQNPNPEDSNNFITYMQDKNKQSTQRKEHNMIKIFKNKKILNSGESPAVQSMKRISKISKIKRHLVQTVDFEEMEKCLYKKRDCITRYDYFMLQKNHKTNQCAKNKNKSFYNQTNYHTLKHSIMLAPSINNSLNLQAKISPNQLNKSKDQYRHLTFRTPRKKFWQKENMSHQKSIMKQKMKSSPKNSEEIKYVEGKSFAKLSK